MFRSQLRHGRQRENLKLATFCASECSYILLHRLSRLAWKNGVDFTGCQDNKLLDCSWHFDIILAPLLGISIGVSTLFMFYIYKFLRPIWHQSRLLICCPIQGESKKSMSFLIICVIFCHNEKMFHLASNLKNVPILEVERLYI